VDLDALHVRHTAARLAAKAKDVSVNDPAEDEVLQRSARMEELQMAVEAAKAMRAGGQTSTLDTTEAKVGTSNSETKANTTNTMDTGGGAQTAEDPTKTEGLWANVWDVWVGVHRYIGVALPSWSLGEGEEDPTLTVPQQHLHRHLSTLATTVKSWSPALQEGLLRKLRNTEHQTCISGEVIYHQGERADTVYVLLEGQVSN
jgi:hypothetical protein